MSEDIVARLREVASWRGMMASAHGPMMDEAADEIERLRADAEHWRLTARGYDFDFQRMKREEQEFFQKTMRQLRDKDAEIERLRAELADAKTQLRDVMLSIRFPGEPGHGDGTHPQPK